MGETWSSCWTVTSTSHGAWESACLWTSPAGFTTCTARASSTETSPPRYRMLMLLRFQQSFIYTMLSDTGNWNCDHVSLCRTVWSAVKTACSRLWWATLAWLKRSLITGQCGETLHPLSAKPLWKDRTAEAWCHSDVIQPENTVLAAQPTPGSCLF